MRWSLVALSFAFVFARPNVAAAAPWPVGAIPGGTYVVHPSEAVMDIAQLKLPDGFTLKFDPQIREVRWRVDSFEFGKQTTIDLSAPPIQQPSGAAAAPKGGQASWGKPGLPGDPGGPGYGGGAGTFLSIKVKTLVSLNTGSLWIKTDGGPGTAGGPGGKGQLGGGSTCGGGSEGPRTRGGPGGPGGPGGVGGWGGQASAVILEIANYPTGHELRPNACSASCGASSRPPGAGGDDGKIVIWGSPGCGGPGGPGGPGGGGGDAHRPPRQCYSFPFTNEFVHGGPPGAPGPAGTPGANGNCGVAVIRGPLAPPLPIPPNASDKTKCELGDQAGCVAYAAQLQQLCAAMPDPHARASCFAKAGCWQNRSMVVSQAAIVCGSGPQENPFMCEMFRTMLATRVSPQACDNASPGGRVF